MAELYQDLLKDTSESFEDGNYFLVTILDLELGQTYPLEFKWKYKDGTVGKDWSAVYPITTPFKTVPGTPQFLSGNVVGGAGAITVEWNGKDSGGADLSDIDRVEVWISEPPFDSTKPAYSSKTKFKTQIQAPTGSYTVALYAVTVNGQYSSVSSAYTVNVTSVQEPIEAPTNPNGFTSRRILAGIEVSWAGTYANGTFSGFEAIKVYAGTSASATGGTYTEVGVLTGNNVKNTIIVPVDGTYVVYGQPTYIHAAAVNKNGTVGTIQANVTNQSLGPGKATDADINDGAVVISKLASDVLTVGNLKAGDINATSYIRAGTAGSARVEISSSTVGSVLPGLTVYASDGTTQLLRAPLTGGLTINGSGTFTGNLSIGSGNSIFKAEPATGIWLGNTSYGSAPFRVSTNGALKSESGDIAGWQINPTFLQNTSGTFKISSTNTDPQIQVGSDAGGHIRISAGTGVAHYSSGTTLSNKFTLSPTGTSQISGWTIGADSISSPSGNVFLYSAGKTGETNLRIQAGSAGQFKVFDDGSITASSAEITGVLTANTGSSIGGWSITSGSISKSSSYIDWAGNPQTLTTTLNSNSSITLSSTSAPSALLNDISSVDNLLRVNHTNANTVVGPGQLEIGSTTTLFGIQSTKLITWVSSGSRDINIKWSGAKTDSSPETVSPAKIRWWNYASSGGESGQRLANLWPNRDISPASYRVLMVDTEGRQYLGPILYFSTTQATTPNNGTGEDGDLYFTTA